MRGDPIWSIFNWKFCAIIKADNDGVWMRKSQKWIDVIDKHSVRMHYTDKARKENNSHAESTCKIVEQVGKSLMWQLGLPPHCGSGPLRYGMR